MLTNEHDVITKEATISIDGVDALYFSANIPSEGLGASFTINLINPAAFFSSEEGKKELEQLMDESLLLCQSKSKED